MRTTTITEFVEKLPKPVLILFGYFLVLAIGSLDTMTSYETSVSLLYLIPISLIAWFEGGFPAALISLFSAITWAMSDLLSGHVYSNAAVPIWNVLMILGMFLIVAYAVATVKRLVIKEREHTHTDELTGIANIRFFYEQARMEISRAIAYKLPLTLAYFAVDNVRKVNDTLGHVAGDYLLHEVAGIIRLTVRSTDIISRLGGARFAILMPETKNEDAAVIISAVRERLMNAVKKHNWPVTFSAGVVICEGPTCKLDELIAMAENLMNTARESGENMVKSKTLDLPLKAS